MDKNHTTAEKLITSLNMYYNILLTRKAAKAKILIKQQFDIISYKWHS